VRFDGAENEVLNKKNLFFPRYHQLDVVRRLIKDTTRKEQETLSHSAQCGFGEIKFHNLAGLSADRSLS
jgi:type I restriction enzyme R subunit